MGIKMSAALDSAGVEWIAERYAKGKGKEPLRCLHCPVQVTHQGAHTRERDDKPIFVPAYFRLLPGVHHADNTVQHPIALHGTVKSKRVVRSKYGQSTVLNLAKSKYIADAGNPDMGIGVEASVWCKNPDWVAGLAEGDEVIVLGMWKVKAGEPSHSTQPAKYRYKSYTTHKMSVWPVLMAQIARLPST